MNDHKRLRKMKNNDMAWKFKKGVSRQSGWE